jgi:DNA polymerase III delta prime subunit
MSGAPGSPLVPDAPVVLLAGPGSRRLEAIAIEAAAHVVCRRSHRPPALDCPDCRRVPKKEHPDVLVAAPEASRRANVPAFEESGGSKETTIPTALVRAVAAESTRLPYEAPRRAIVLLDVDKTEPAAFSALLKILEEPPTKTRFLLTATRPRLLPPTILSRVVLCALPGLKRAETVAVLRERGVNADEAEARASFEPSDPEAARALDIQEARALRDGLLEAASGVFLGGSLSWALHLAALLAADDAAETVSRLGLLAQLLRDAAAAPVDPAGHHVVFKERFADLKLLGAADAAELLDAASNALGLAASLAESRRNVRLAVEAFALGAVQPAAPYPSSP